MARNAHGEWSLAAVQPACLNQEREPSEVIRMGVPAIETIYPNFADTDIRFSRKAVACCQPDRGPFRQAG